MFHVKLAVRARRMFTSRAELRLIFVLLAAPAASAKGAVAPS